MGAAPNPAAIVLLLLIISAAVSLLFLIIAIRGRRIGSHPACRACAFDLSGVVPAARACPECGKDLSRPRAIMKGRRAARPWLAAISALVLAASVGGAGALAYFSVSRAGWNSIKPVWLLAGEAEGSDRAAAAAAIRELDARLARGSLTDAQALRVIRQALTRQADRAKPWHPEWGALLDAGIAANRLSIEQRVAYFENMSSPVIECRKRVRAAAESEVLLHLRGGRCGPATPFSVALKRLVAVAMPSGGGPGEKLLDHAGGAKLSAVGAGGGSLGMGCRTPSTPGTYRITVIAEYDVSTGARFDSFVHTGTVTDEIEVTVVGPDEPLVMLNPDPSLEGRIRAAFKRIVLMPAGPRRAPSLDVDIDALPVSIAFNVKARRTLPDGTEQTWDLPALVSRSGSSGISFGLSPLAGLTPGTVDLVLTPDPRLAERTASIEEIWGGTLVLKGVIVEGDAVEPGTTGASASPIADSPR